jgi:hypothetical protein
MSQIETKGTTWERLWCRNGSAVTLPSGEVVGVLPGFPDGPELWTLVRPDAEGKKRFTWPEIVQLSQTETVFADAAYGILKAVKPARTVGGLCQHLGEHTAAMLLNMSIHRIRRCRVHMGSHLTANEMLGLLNNVENGPALMLTWLPILAAENAAANNPLRSQPKKRRGEHLADYRFQ